MCSTSVCLQAATADLSEEDDQQDENLCIVCWEQLREIIFYQCMHMVRSNYFDTALSATQCSHNTSCLPERAMS